jgi:hypothetical protein
MTSQVQLFPFAAIVAGLMMMRIGSIKRVLVTRRKTARCPSCGRIRSGSVCTWCTGR